MMKNKAAMLNYIITKLHARVQHFDADRYFQLRNRVISGGGVEVL